MNSDKQSRVDLSLLTTCDVKRSEQFNIDERTELLSLLKSSYNNYALADIFDIYPSYQHHYVLRMRINNTLIASRQFVIVNDPDNAPGWTWDICHALKINHFAIGSRAIVHPYLRSKGLGTNLVKKGNHEIFSQHGVSTILGSSTNFSAVALYIQQGAELWADDINKLYQELPPSWQHQPVESMLANRHIFTNRLTKPVRYFYRQHTMDDQLENIHHYSMPVQNIDIPY